MIAATAVILLIVTAVTPVIMLAVADITSIVLLAVIAMLIEASSSNNYNSFVTYVMEGMMIFITSELPTVSLRLNATRTFQAYAGEAEHVIRV